MNNFISWLGQKFSRNKKVAEKKLRNKTSTRAKGRRSTDTQIFNHPRKDFHH